MMDAFISDYQEARKFTKAKEAGLDLAAFNKTAYDFSVNDIFDVWNGDKDGFFARWTGSMLLPEVIAWMQNRVNADAKGDKTYHGYELPRLAIFSTHDVTTGSILTILNRALKTKKLYTPYASDMVMELHSDAGKWSVKIVYNGHELINTDFENFKSSLEKQFYTQEKLKEMCGYP